MGEHRATDPAPIIRLIDVTKSYRHLNVLKPVNLDIQDGEFLTILGPSGSGKTTILRMIGGLTAPTSGRILLRGDDISRMPINERPFNTVFQDYALFPHMTVARNVGYGLRIRKLPKAEIASRVAEVLETVNLSDKASRYPNELSGGQRQRVALARAIVCEPQVILLDEPLGALDAELRRSMQEFLKRLQRRIRTTFVFITHDQEEAIAMSDRIAVMEQGNLVQVGTPQDIYYRPQTEFVAKFFGENNLLPTLRTSTPGLVSSPLGNHQTSTALKGEVLLAIRPESFNLHMGEAVPEGHSTARVKLEGVTFLGATTQISVLAGEHRLKVRVPTASTSSGLADSEDLTLRWADTDVSFLQRGNAPFDSEDGPENV